MPLRRFFYILRRSLRYVGIALSGLAVILVLIIVSVATNKDLAGNWLALVIWTGFAFGLPVQRLSQSWRHARFWITVSALLLIHVALFSAALLSYPAWRPVWFMLICPPEAIVVWAILGGLFPTRSHQKRAG